MLLSRSVLAKGLAVMTAAGLALVAFPGTGQALTGTPPTLTGVVTCDGATGNQVVAWTFTNESGASVHIDTATVGDAGLSSGATIDTTATMSPNPVTNGSTSTDETRAEGAAVGDYHLVITFTYADLDPTVDGEVVLPGGCEAVAVVTTVAQPTTTTTTPAPAPAAVSTSPKFTG